MPTSIDFIRYNTLTRDGLGAARDLWIAQALEVATDPAISPHTAAAKLAWSAGYLPAAEALELVRCCRAAQTAQSWDDIPRTTLADYGECQEPSEAPECLAACLIHQCYEKWCEAQD